MVPPTLNPDWLRHCLCLHLSTKSGWSREEKRTIADADLRLGQIWYHSAQTCQHWEISKRVILRAAAMGHKGPKFEEAGGRGEVHYWAEGSESPLPTSNGVNIFSSFSHWMKLSTLNDPNTILGIYKIGSHAGYESASGSCRFCTRMQVWPACQLAGVCRCTKVYNFARKFILASHVIPPCALQLHKIPRRPGPCNAS